MHRGSTTKLHIRIEFRGNIGVKEPLLDVNIDQNTLVFLIVNYEPETDGGKKAEFQSTRPIAEEAPSVSPIIHSVLASGRASATWPLKLASNSK